jgi:hypothetical protein
VAAAIAKAIGVVMQQLAELQDDAAYDRA